LLGDSDALRAAAANQGYLHFRKFLPDSLLAPVRAFTRDAFARLGWVQPDGNNPPAMQAIPDARLSGRGWDDPNWVRFQTTFSTHPDLLALAEAPCVMEVLEAIMGEPAWPATINFCWIKLPGSPEHTTLPHQDEWYLPCCGSMWTMWLPLVDTPFEVGPLGIVPGSNNRGVAEHRTAFSGLPVEAEVAWASGAVKAGDVIFFAARTIHCAWSNVSATLARVSADIRYEPRSVGNDSRLRTGQK
jgi:ectoine hydroxylase-related dioxygenase (phytanoyl-CoA dioxygenase family)